MEIKVTTEDFEKVMKEEQIETSLHTLNGITVPRPRHPEDQVLYFAFEKYSTKVYLFYQDKELLHIRHEDWEGGSEEEARKMLLGLEQITWLKNGIRYFLPIKKVVELKQC